MYIVPKNQDRNEILIHIQNTSYNAFKHAFKKYLLKAYI